MHASLVHAATYKKKKKAKMEAKIGSYSYKIGSRVYTLHDIEHDILRGGKTRLDGSKKVAGSPANISCRCVLIGCLTWIWFWS